ncbi:MAG: hypothetical protein R3E84_22500 [Pseudomonadales bacterium]|nr:hypothetical protein [Pseudomonadales bacterium]
MIPAPGRTLTDLAMRLMLGIAPQTTTTFAAADCGLIAQLLLTMGQEFERAVDTRMQDIHELKALFGTAPADAARARFMGATPASLHLRDVNALHDEGMQLLAILHAQAEADDAALNARIWAFLRAHSERHKFETLG